MPNDLMVIKCTTMASPHPDINDMLLSQQASRRSQLLKSRIQASLLTIANWRLENEQEYQNDDIDTGRTSPSGTSCGSNDTLQSMINVVRYDCDGKQRELAVDSRFVAQNCEPWLHRDAQLSTKERVVKKSDDFKYLAKHSNEGSFKHENLSDEPLVKTGNVAPHEEKQGLPFSSTQITAPNAKRKSRKSSMTGGDHIRIMKQYDVKLLDSMMQNSPTKSAATTEPEDIHQRLPFRGETEEHTSTQDEEILVPMDSPNIISNENNGERQAKLLPKTSRMTPPCPSLERRVSQLMTTADDVQTDKTTILFPHAQRRSISGKREKLLGGTHQKRSNRCGTTASWWNPLTSFRLTRNSSTISSLQQEKNRSLSSIPENKKVSWDEVPDVSEFLSTE